MENPKKEVSRIDNLIERITDICRRYIDNLDNIPPEYKSIISLIRNIEAETGKDLQILHELSNHIRSALHKNNATDDIITKCYSSDDLVKYWVDNSDVVYIESASLYLIFKNRKVMSDFIDNITPCGSRNSEGQIIPFNPYQVIKVDMSNGLYLILNSEYDNLLVQRVKNMIKKVFGEHKIDVYSNKNVTTISIEDIKKHEISNRSQVIEFMKLIEGDGELSGKVKRPEEVPLGKYTIELIPCCDNMHIDGQPTKIGWLTVNININSNNTTNTTNTINHSNGVSISGSGNATTIMNPSEVARDYIRNNNPTGQYIMKYYNNYKNNTDKSLRRNEFSDLVENMGYKKYQDKNGTYWK
jgi:hypothetical protein